MDPGTPSSPTPACITFTIDGRYEGTEGEFILVPRKSGERTFVCSTISAVIAKDDSLTMKIARSGDFPFAAMADFFFMRDVVNKVELEADRRKRAK